MPVAPLPSAPPSAHHLVASCRLLLLLLLAAGLVAAAPPARAQSGPSPGGANCTNGTADGFPCRHVDLLAHLTLADLSATASSANDIWGWTDAATGREYALIGLSDATAFVDVTNTRNPTVVGLLPTRTAASLWRDVKVHADHAYIVSEAFAHGMQVFDLTQLRGVANPPVAFTETAHYGRFGSAHNLVINEDTGFAYAVGITGAQTAPSGAQCGPGLHIIDLATPAAPQFAGCYNDLATGRAGGGYTHDAQCVVYDGPDTAYQGREICIGSNETGISIADVTAKSSVTKIANGFYPRTGYAHQGWLSEDHRYFFLDDELDESGGLASRTRTIVWDLADLDNPFVLAEHLGTTTAIDHNQYVKGGFLFQANYRSGLRILDITDPAAPVEAGFFDTFPADDAPAFDGAWSVYPFLPSGHLLVSSIGEGLFVLDASSALPVELAAFEAQVDADGRTADLAWRTISETNNAGFYVEHDAPTGSGWTALGFVEGAGTTTEAQRYRFTTPPLGVGTHRFRLRQVDFDGTATRSDPVSVELGITGAYEITGPFPNPTRGASTLRLAVAERQPVRVALYDALGRRVRTLHDGPLAPGDPLTLDLDTGGLASGVYLWRITGRTFSTTRRLVVAR